jgi:hypothetical protein
MESSLERESNDSMGVLSAWRDERRSGAFRKQRENLHISPGRVLRNRISSIWEDWGGKGIPGPRNTMAVDSQAGLQLIYSV